MDIPEAVQSLFNDKDQDVVAVRDPNSNAIVAWRVERLIAVALGQPTTEIPLKNFRPTLRTWFGDDFADRPLSDLIDHIERVNAADLDSPILVFGKDRILDGAHRFVLATMKGKRQAPGSNQHRFRSGPAEHRS